MNHMIYHTTVKAVGSDVSAFAKKGFLITFGEPALVSLRDFCYFVEVNPVVGEIKPGSRLVIDDKEYKITKAGKIAAQNLGKLGHLTVFFNGDRECLPGSICVEKSEMPELKAGSRISIIE